MCSVVGGEPETVQEAGGGRVVYGVALLVALLSLGLGVTAAAVGPESMVALLVQTILLWLWLFSMPIAVVMCALAALLTKTAPLRIHSLGVGFVVCVAFVFSLRAQNDYASSEVLGLGPNGVLAAVASGIGLVLVVAGGLATRADWQRIRP